MDLIEPRLKKRGLHSKSRHSSSDENSLLPLYNDSVTSLLFGHRFDVYVDGLAGGRSDLRWNRIFFVNDKGFFLKKNEPFQFEGERQAGAHLYYIPWKRLEEGEVMRGVVLLRGMWNVQNIASKVFHRLVMWSAYGFFRCVKPLHVTNTQGLHRFKTLLSGPVCRKPRIKWTSVL